MGSLRPRQLQTLLVAAVHALQSLYMVVKQLCTVVQLASWY